MKAPLVDILMLTSNFERRSRQKSDGHAVFYTLHPATESEVFSIFGGRHLIPSLASSLTTCWVDGRRNPTLEICSTEVDKVVRYKCKPELFDPSEKSCYDVSSKLESTFPICYFEVNKKYPGDPVCYDQFIDPFALYETKVPMKPIVQDVIDAPECMSQIIDVINNYIKQFNLEVIDVRCRMKKTDSGRTTGFETSKIANEIFESIHDNLTVLTTRKREYSVLYSICCNKTPYNYYQIIIKSTDRSAVKCDRTVVYDEDKGQPCPRCHRYHGF